MYTEKVFRIVMSYGVNSWKLTHICTRSRKLTHMLQFNTHRDAMYVFCNTLISFNHPGVAE